MPNIDAMGEVISTDILIIGGGLAGLVAAIQAKELPVDVLIVDKQAIGWSGKAPKVGGGLWVMMPDEDVDKLVEYHVKNIGCYLNDQELLASYARESYGAVEQLMKWGVSLARDEQGKLQTAKHPSGLWSGTGIDRDMLTPLRSRAQSLGAKMLDKVQVVELLRHDDRVVGAVGFNIVDGRFLIFRAKAVILANGSCNFKVKRMWSSGCGDGIASAYRAGAEMRNAEFGNFFDIDRKDSDSPLPSGGYAYLYNALDEKISERYAIEWESDTPISIILAMEKEVNEGRGPICVDPTKIQWEATSPPPFFNGRWGMPKTFAYWDILEVKHSRYSSPSLNRVEVTAALNAELSPLRVDHEMKTSLNALWAIGDACYQGSSWAGAVPAPPGRLRGSGLMNTMFTSLRGGRSAGLFAAAAKSQEIDPAQVGQYNSEIFAPLRKDGGILPAAAIYSLQEIVCKIKYNLRRSNDRLQEALSKLEDLQPMLQNLYARDSHGLGKCWEVKSMALCAEMTFRAALARTESRGTHFREDYPARDDRNWLKWVILKQAEGGMSVSTEPVPIDKYGVKP